MKYKSPTFKGNKVILSLNLLRQATEEEWLPSLCYYVWLKSLHQRPKIYAYTLRKVATQIKHSPASVSKHIQVLINKGLAHIDENGTLCLKSTKSFFLGTLSPKFYVGVAKGFNKKEQIALLRYGLINRCLDNQSKSYTNKNNCLKMLAGKEVGLKETKKLLRLSRKYSTVNDIESSMDKDFTLSNAKIGEICHRSKVTGIRIQRQLNKMKLIKSFKRIELVAEGHNRRSFFELCLNGSYFVSNKGNVYRRKPNGILMCGSDLRAKKDAKNRKLNSMVS